MIDKMYILKSDPTQSREFPIPKDLENWIELDFDPDFDYRRKTYDVGLGQFVDTPLNSKQQKALGIEIQGQMISLNESNQNGLSSISTMIDKSIALGQSPFPIFPNLETKTGKARLVANDQAEFDSIFLTFGLARQQFFE